MSLLPTQSPSLFHLPVIAPGSVRGLERVAAAPTILEAIRVAPLARREIVASATTEAALRAAVVSTERAIDSASDRVTAIAAVHLLGALPGERAAGVLADLARAGGNLSAHAAWAALDRRPTGVLLEPLTELVTLSGLTGMLAQQTLERWARREPWLVAAALRAAVARTGESTSRQRLVETLGLVADRSIEADLQRFASDLREPSQVRSAALAALGDRRHGHIHRRPAARRGLTVAQVHLGSVLDAELEAAGDGNTGGVATLLVSVGEALVRQPDIGTVVSIGRQAGDRPSVVHDRPTTTTSGHIIESIQFEPGTATSGPEQWAARVAAERGLRRLLAAHRPDVVHLRMADVGSLATANVAAEMGIPAVFTLAPDPHALIAAREASGELDRRTFEQADATQQLWYRVALVDRLARQSSQIALFPRPGLTARLRELVGVDVAAQPHRYAVVPEGVDVESVRRSPAVAQTTRVVDELRSRIAALPPARHGLPLVLSVGRLAEVKGMARLVEAYAGDERLRDQANLVIVGGNLTQPSGEEAAELARIRAVIAADPAATDGVILLGHRPNREVAQLMALARDGDGDGDVDGDGGLIGAFGAYACASTKEEFGLAIVEALAAGLPVTAPLNGGPATYVEQGRTGFLVDTLNRSDLADGIRSALGISAQPGRAEYAAARIASEYDIRHTAAALERLYLRAAAERLPLAA